MRDWIDTNSWIVNEIVIGFFLVMTIWVHGASLPTTSFNTPTFWHDRTSVGFERLECHPLPSRPTQLSVPGHAFNSSSRALASFRSAVSKPSVNPAREALPGIPVLTSNAPSRESPFDPDSLLERGGFEPPVSREVFPKEKPREYWRNLPSKSPASSRE